MADDFHARLIETLPHLRAFAMAITRDRERANDLIQDTVVRALSASRQFKPGTNFKAWLFTILRNQHIDSFRKNRVQPVSLDDERVGQRPAPPGQEASLVLSELHRALKDLSADQRETLVLIGVNGFTYEEAAEICGCPVGTIRSRLCRARRQLQDVLLGDDASVPAAATGRRRDIAADLGASLGLR